jgi:2-polyprenyl-3-methyl-5-hydroxy-6-metoxy-1,4-benzoquinol methylase
MIYMNPRFSVSETTEYYTEADIYSPEAQLQHQQPLLSCYGALLRNIGSRLTGGRLLDVGCGVGVFLKCARDDGWDVVGTEGSPHLAAFAATHAAAEVHSCYDIAGAPLEPQSFDVITFLHVLEHLPDPLKTLRLAAKLLKPDGLLIGQVPNQYLDVWARMPIIRGRISRVSERQKTNLHHLSFFTPSTFRLLFEKAELTPVWTSTYAKSNRRHMIESRLPFLSLVKRSLYAAASRLGYGPVIEIYGVHANPAAESQLDSASHRPSGTS